MHFATTPCYENRQRENKISDAAERLRDELEVVSYVTSHDLLAPLRNIQNCCEELQRQIHNNTEQKIRDEVQTLLDETARLKIMMQAMLDEVRLEIFQVSHAPLDSNEILQSAIATLQPEIKATNTVLTYDTLPMVIGHRNRLTRLFAHIIDNAIKFNDSSSPAIHISALQNGEVWQFCVADNGIGMDEEHYDIIFRLFQRLHTAEKYPGHGIGLAHARKIVESHGGNIWVESKPGIGSRFFFTLPAAIK